VVRGQTERRLGYGFESAHRCGGALCRSRIVMLVPGAIWRVPMGVNPD
jgi:hypothetical protein